MNQVVLLQYLSQLRSYKLLSLNSVVTMRRYNIKQRKTRLLRREPHTSEKFGTVVTYTNNYEKKRTISLTTTRKSERFPYLIDTIVHVAKDNKYSLLTLFTICLDVHVANNNKCNLRTVARVTENSDMSLRSCRGKQRLSLRSCRVK